MSSDRFVEKNDYCKLYLNYDIKKQWNLLSKTWNIYVNKNKKSFKINYLQY